jgi:hypothetical protein
MNFVCSDSRHVVSKKQKDKLVDRQQLEMQSLNIPKRKE